MKNDQKRYKIVFMGTPKFAVPALKALIAGPDEVCGVVTQPDRPRGRGRKLLPSPVKVEAQKANIQVFQPEKVGSPEFVEVLEGLEPDLLVVCAFGQILPQRVLDIPRIMPINIHGSLLPRYRGAAPIQWAILNGDKETGITIMKMDAGMDTGPMLLKRSLPIGPETTFGDLSSSMATLGAEALTEALDLLEKGRLKEEVQPEWGITYAPPIKKEQLKIDWNAPARRIHCQLRAFDPRPGAWTIMEGQRVRLFSPRLVSDEAIVHGPGTVLKADEDGLLVSCLDRALLIKEIQWPGKKRIPVSDFLRGRKVTPGTRLG